MELITLVEKVFELLLNKGVFISVAESCTGGLFAAALVDQPGMSDVFWGGIVTYSNEAKVKLLGVNPATIATEGAVSEQCAREMARGCLDLSGVEIAIAITGIAGPSGGSPDKPIGTVFIAIAGRYLDYVKRFQFNGNRNQVRQQTVVAALRFLQENLETYIPVTNQINPTGVKY